MIYTNSGQRPGTKHSLQARYRQTGVARTPILALVLCLAGCATSTQLPVRGSDEPGKTARSGSRLAPIRKMLEDGAYDEALRTCVEVSQSHPQTPGLEDLRQQVMRAIDDRELRRAAERRRQDQGRMAAETAEALSLPESYGIRRTTTPMPRDRLAPDSPMRERLDRTLTLSLRAVTLDGIMDVLSDELGINLIADYQLGIDQRINIEATDLPVRELLGYVARNLDVEFHVGDQVIWVTRADPAAAPLETRVYRLRQGIQMHGSDWGDAPADNQNITGDIAALSFKATVPSKVKTSLEQIMAEMVPEHPGAASHFDRGTHTLFVRNTRANLEIIENIVNALDITPPQVLIEARFIEVMVDDLRELGVEWMLQSPWSLSRKGVMRDGVQASEDRIRIGSGGISYTPFETGEGGPHPLGPQGAFGLIGSPPTDDQGLSLAIEGVLTRPAFEAMLHALEISGKGQTLSMPRVTTINNSPAKLRSGTDLRYFEEFHAQAFSLVDRNNEKYTVTALIPRGRPSIEELGITLVAVPSVGADLQGITLLLNPSISSLDGFVSYQDDSMKPDPDIDPISIRQVVVKLPVFSRREVATRLTVQSGDTVVMGGLMDSVEQDTVHKVPVLGDLPLVGTLFRRSGVSEQRRNLLIFVTATVISDRGESLVSPLTRENGTADHF